MQSPQLSHLTYMMLLLACVSGPFSKVTSKKDKRKQVRTLLSLEPVYACKLRRA